MMCSFAAIVAVHGTLIAMLPVGANAFAATFVHCLQCCLLRRCQHGVELGFGLVALLFHVATVCFKLRLVFVEQRLSILLTAFIHFFNFDGLLVAQLQGLLHMSGALGCASRAVIVRAVRRGLGISGANTAEQCAGQKNLFHDRTSLLVGVFTVRSNRAMKVQAIGN